MQLLNINAIARRYDHVVISPHFDDAAVSCGGRIIDRVESGEKVLVATVFTSRSAGKNPFRKKYRRLLDYDRRGAEDKAAMTSLGVDFIWLGYREILLRENIPLFRYWPSFRKTRSNLALSHALALDFQDICGKAGCKNLMLPMAVGQHMDHQIVFQAGAHLLRKEKKPFHMTFYEDYPYVLFPNMLYYRMKTTGWIRRVRQNSHKMFKPAQPFAYRQAVKLLSSTPSFQLGAAIAGPLYLLIILFFGLYTHTMLKTGPGISGEGRIFSQEVCDISHTLERKLNAVMAYQSQLAASILTRERIKKAMQTYSEAVGSPRGRFCERYLRTEPD